LKKLGRKKKETPTSFVTRPVTSGSSPVTVHVKNRFKHTRPSAHVVSAEQQKPKSALESLQESYGDNKELESGEPPAKQTRTELPIPVTPMGVVSNATTTTTTTVTTQATLKPALILQHSTGGVRTQVATRAASTTTITISLCPQCKSRQNIKVQNGFFICSNCNRNFLPIKSIKTNPSLEFIPATFYTTPSAIATQRPLKSQSAMPKATARKKQTETIDLISSDDDDGDSDEAEEEPQQQHSSNVANDPVTTADTANSSSAASSASTTIRDRLRLQGGESGVAKSTSSPTPPETPTNEYVFHCNKVMFGELYGQSVLPTKVRDNRMFLSLECLILRNNVQASEKYTLSVGSNDVEQILVYFGRVPSFVAIETAKKFATVACKRIGKEVLCPGSEEPKKRYILLALNSAFKNDNEADSERRSLITAVSPWARVNVLSHSEAIQLISQANLEVNQQEVCYGQTNKALGPVETLLIYPPSLKSGGIPITTLDVACLDEGTYLNDIIIDFYLKYICESVMTKAQKEKTYIFNSYFYKRLTHKTSNKTDPTVIHAQVKKWTRNVDIFQKDFVIIPINEHCHWYLAIICFHGQQKHGELDLNEKEEEEEEEDEESCDEFNMKDGGSITTSADIVARDENSNDSEIAPELTESPPPPPVGVDATVEPVAQSGPPIIESITEPVAEAGSTKEQAQDVVKPDESVEPVQQQTVALTPNTAPEIPTEQTDKEPVPPAPVKEYPKQANELNELYRPCILIFDSLVGSGHSRVFTHLRNYLTQEWISRKPNEEPKVFDKNTMKGSYPKIPRQNNDCDCGVFLLQYAEYFFTSAIRNFCMPIHLEKWFTVQSVTQKREDVKELISKLSEEYKTILNNNKQQESQKSKTKKRKAMSPS